MEKIKIVSRKSNLAILQVEELMKQIDVKWELITLDSYGDKNKKISLMNNPMANIFTKEIDEAIINGVGDIAIHSAKDLPYPLDPELEIIALIKPFDQTDSLTSRDNLTLEELPKGASIGTSSEERKRQILERRPDLNIYSIRGTIEERIEQVDNGDCDAAIIATCALKRLGLESRISQVLDFTTHPLQGILAVTAKRNRLEYKKLFREVDILKDYGRVSLVGFGPGDPELLTIKGDKLLQRADIIYYDALITEPFLERYSGEKIYVGKRKENHSYTQDEIGELLYRSAISGKNVVRLKGGDPFIFGRGGEEYDYLSSRAVKVDIVPGITAAQGASAYTKVPLTHRGLSRDLSLHTGHQGVLEADSGTEVFYMGGTKLKEVKSTLLNKGKGGETPVLLIENATLANQWVIKTTVDTMDRENPNLPVLIVCGKVAEKYVESKIILNTGLRDYAYGLCGDIRHQPFIKVEEIDYKVDIDSYDTVMFTSITAVDYFCSRYNLNGKKIISIGKSTDIALGRYGLKSDFTSGKPDSDTLLEGIKGKEFGKILYPSSSLSKNRLHDLDSVTTLVIYKTESIKNELIEESRLGGIIFTSPSTVDSFVESYKTIPNVDIFCFGKFTLNRIKSYREDLYVQTIQT